MTIRLAIAGAAGRMGRSTIEHAVDDPRFEIVARLERSEARTLPECDVLIDFSDAAGTMEWVEVCLKRRIPMVIGATGHEDEQATRILDASKAIGIVKAANFSVGLPAVLKIVQGLATELGDSYDIEIVEAHHRNKVDAPSGTALAIVEAIQDARNEPKTEVVHGRSGTSGVRPRRQIGVHALRMGDVVGQHEIHFSGPGETISVRHTVHSRATFAAGALRAAAWVVGKPPGMYSMGDVR